MYVCMCVCLVCIIQDVVLKEISTVFIEKQLPTPHMKKIKIIYSKYYSAFEPYYSKIL